MQFLVPLFDAPMSINESFSSSCKVSLNLLNALKLCCVSLCLTFFGFTELSLLLLNHPFKFKPVLHGLIKVSLSLFIRRNDLLHICHLLHCCRICTFGALA